MDCPRCNASIRGNERNCPTCGEDVGYPNVRAALEFEEKTALSERYKTATGNSSRRGCLDVMLTLLSELGNSVAVICRSYSEVKKLVSNNNELYATFYLLVGAGARRLEGTKMDIQRNITDSIIFPFYGDQIRFAALSLDGIGVRAYGDCSVVLKDIAISKRATVFEENSVTFCEKYRLGVANLSRPGHRATWDDRGLLAISKLEPLLGIGTNKSDYAKLLVGESGQDFVEVHIFGSLNVGSIEKIVASSPKNEPDKILQAEIARRVALEVVP